jgi:hypothetical protein
MNERIRELAKEAGFTPGIMGLERFTYFDTEKFAELIVRESIQVVDDMADPEEDSDLFVWVLHNASEKIKQHFGVEE